MTVQPMSQHARPSSGHVSTGLAMIVLGLAVYAARHRAWELEWWGSWWAVLLVVGGAARAIYPGESNGRAHSRRFGAWLMGVGVWAWLSQNGIFGLDYETSWPLLVVLAGVMVVWKALSDPRPARGMTSGKEN